MRLTIHPLDLTEHLDLVHAWVTHPRSAFWQMQHLDRAGVADAYRRIQDDPHHHAFLGRADGRPAFVTETYHPRHRELVGVAGVEPSDLGMHLLVAPPPAEPVPGFTRAVMRAVLDFCFADPSVGRVVVEPDVRNQPILDLNATVGFRVDRHVDLTGKTAALSFCSRADFRAATDHREPAR